MSTMELPDPPWRVLANAGQETRWWLCYQETGPLFFEQSNWRDLLDREKRGTLNGSGIARAGELNVIPHPRNDPEAVKLIQDAKSEPPQ